MQMQLPIFPSTTKLINTSVGIFEKDAKALREKGPNHFFNREEHRGRAHKLTDEVLKDAQQMIDNFYSVGDVARLLGVTDGALRYHIKKGNIKKKWKL